jgi:phasin family protein
MSSITEQFSAVTKSQLEAQFQIFNTLAHTAVDSAEKLIALHLNAGKASVESSSAAAKKLLEVKDAKELFNVTRDAPTGLDSLLAYSRELFAIASGAQAELIKGTRTPLQQVQQSVVQPAAKAATDAVAAAAPAVATAAAVVAPAAAQLTAEEPAAEAVAVPAAAAVAAPVAAPVAAAAAEPAPVATNIHDAVASTVAADAETAPLAATVAPTPAADIKPGIKPSFPPPKAIPVAADSKASKLKAVPPKAKQAEIPAGKQKK